MNPKTERARALRATLRTQATELADRVTNAVRSDYPDLTGWALRCPSHQKIIRTGSGEDDWRWGAYRSAQEECAALRRYIERVTTVAARRISEAYGLGAGDEWARRHGLTADDPDHTARILVRKSLASVCHMR